MNINYIIKQHNIYEEACLIDLKKDRNHFF